MKKSLFISAALIGALVTSCKKEEDPAPTTTTTPTSTSTYLISMDSTTTTEVGQSTRVRKFSYNSSKKLIKVEYKYLPSSTYTNYDTLIYNVNGTLSCTYNYSVGNSTANSSNVLYYNGSGELTSIDETGTDYSTSPPVAFAKTHTFTYASGKISTMTSVYTSGANGNSNDTLTDFVYVGNNISTLIYNGMPVTATVSTTAPNPYYGLGSDPTDFIYMVNQNNILTAYLTADPTQIFENNSYTYADGRVSIITSDKTDNNGTPYTNVTYITYKGY